MKKAFILVVALLLLSLKINAQVGIGTTNPDPSAVLDVVSTDKGLLLPRIASITNITTPVAGLMIFDNSKQCMRYYNGTKWSDCMGGITPAFTCGSAMSDIDGNSYPTVMIDNKCWMAADLKVSRYPNGDAIPYIDDDANWGTLVDNNTDDAYSFYGDNNNDGTIDITYPDYGALYTYAAAIADNWARDNIANQGICPDGWHLPTDTEWTALTDFLGGINVAGGKMKEVGSSHWTSTNVADNSSGFTALPNGFRASGHGMSNNIENGGYWRSSTEGNSIYSYNRAMYYHSTVVSNLFKLKSHGYCIRCIQD